MFSLNPDGVRLVIGGGVSATDLDDNAGAVFNYRAPWPLIATEVWGRLAAGVGAMVVAGYCAARQDEPARRAAMLAVACQGSTMAAAGIGYLAAQHTGEAIVPLCRAASIGSAAAFVSAAPSLAALTMLAAAIIGIVLCTADVCGAISDCGGFPAAFDLATAVGAAAVAAAAQVHSRRFVWMVVSAAQADMDRLDSAWRSATASPIQRRALLELAALTARLAVGVPRLPYGTRHTADPGSTAKAERLSHRLIRSVTTRGRLNSLTGICEGPPATCLNQLYSQVRKKRHRDREGHTDTGIGTQSAAEIGWEREREKERGWVGER